MSGRAGEDVACASFVGFFHLLNHSCCPNVVFDSAQPVHPAAPDQGLPPTFALRALADVAEGAARAQQDRLGDGTAGGCSLRPMLRPRDGALDATGAAEHARRAAESNSRAERMECRATVHPERQ